MTTNYPRELEYLCASSTNHETYTSLPWRHNEGGGVPNHRALDCLLNLLFRRRSKKISELRIDFRWKNCTRIEALVQFFPRKIERINRPTRHVLLHTFAGAWSSKELRRFAERYSTRITIPRTPARRHELPTEIRASDRHLPVTVFHISRVVWFWNVRPKIQHSIWLISIITATLHACNDVTNHLMSYL